MTLSIYIPSQIRELIINGWEFTNRYLLYIGGAICDTLGTHVDQTQQLYAGIAGIVTAFLLILTSIGIIKRVCSRSTFADTQICMLTKHYRFN